MSSPRIDIFFCCAHAFPGFSSRAVLSPFMREKTDRVPSHEKGNPAAKANPFWSPVLWLGTSEPKCGKDEHAVAANTLIYAPFPFPSAQWAPPFLPSPYFLISQYVLPSLSSPLPSSLSFWREFNGRSRGRVLGEFRTCYVRILPRHP